MSKNDNNPSFFDRLLGRNHVDEYDEIYDEEMYDEENFDDELGEDEYMDEDKPAKKTKKDVIELPINLTDTDTELVIQTSIPGINGGDDIEIDISRDSFTIETSTSKEYLVDEGTALYQEIEFGSYYRSIPLPAEINVEESEAEIRDGLLTVRMPKIDKNARRKVSVRKQG